MAYRDNNPFAPKDIDPTLASFGERSDVSLKGLVTNQHFSEETICFKATVYIRNKRMFCAENDGQGGANHYFPLKNQSREDFDKAIKVARHEASEYMLAKYRSEEEELMKDFIKDSIDRYANTDSTALLDWLVTDLINERHALKELRSLLKRKITIYDPAKNEVSSWPSTAKPTEENVERYKAYFVLTNPVKGSIDWKWMNLIPEAEAYKYWRTAR
jgi:hypothetical protein